MTCGIVHLYMQLVSDGFGMTLVQDCFSQNVFTVGVHLDKIQKEGDHSSTIRFNVF